MVVDVELDSLPLGVVERLTRQRAKCGAIEPLEQLTAARVVCAHGSVVELDEELRDSSVELGEGEECLIAKTREDPALGHLHGDLDLGLDSWLPRTRRQNRSHVMARPLVERPLHAGVVLACDRDGGLELVGHEVLRGQ